MKTLITLCAVLLISGSVSVGAQFMNITFDGDTIGSAPSVGAATVTPIATVQAIGGWNNEGSHEGPPTAAGCGTFVVGNVAGMTKAAIMTASSTNYVPGALYADISFGGLGISSSQMSLEFDINVLAAQAGTYHAQSYFLNDTSDVVGLVFGISVDDASPSPDPYVWSFRFAVAPTSDTGGVFAFRNSGNNRLMSFGSYVEGQTYNLILAADYSTGTVDAYIDDVLAVDDFPFWPTGVTTPSTTREIFMHLSGEKYASQVAIDNIQGYTTAIPEPATMSLLGLGALALLKRRRS